MTRNLFLCTILVSALCTWDASAKAANVIFESGTLGPTGLTFDDFDGGMPEPSGAFVSDFAFTGVRFELTQPVATTRVGAHVVIDPGHDDSFFGAIVRLNSATDFPNSGDLSTPDVLGERLLAFPDTSTEVFGDLALSLEPGWYALVFGSGLFGATGRGAAVANNPDIGSPSYIAFVPNSQWVDLSTLPGPFANFRLVVEGNIVSEPSAFVAIPFMLLSLLCARKAARRFNRLK
jgi:hypothetical protein